MAKMAVMAEYGKKREGAALVTEQRIGNASKIKRF